MKTTKRSKVIPPIFVGKWTTSILFSLDERPHRHGQLRRRLRRVSQRMLTKTLRSLEFAGLVERSATEPDTSVVQYSLTELGRGFIAPLTSMCDWARHYGNGVSAEVHLA